MKIEILFTSKILSLVFC